MIVSILDWTIERFQDALLTAELDPGPVPPTGRAGGEEGSPHPAVSRRIAASNRNRGCNARVRCAPGA